MTQDWRERHEVERQHREEGKAVQFKYINCGKVFWYDDPAPAFSASLEWRVKPEEREPRRFILAIKNGNPYIRGHVPANEPGYETVEVIELLPSYELRRVES